MSKLPAAGKKFQLWRTSPILSISPHRLLPAIAALVLGATALLWTGNSNIALTLDGSAAALLLLLLIRTDKQHPSEQACIPNDTTTAMPDSKAQSQAQTNAGNINAGNENISAEKFKFVASIGHDLCQPIHAQSLFLSMLAGTPLTPQQIEIIAHISTATKSYSTMLNALIEFSRIEAGMIKPRMETFKLQPLLNKLEREHAHLAQLKGLDYRCRETALAVHSDPALLESILHPLLANALRYTDKGGLLIACRKRGTLVVIEVWDSGSGISEEERADLLQGYKQSAKTNPNPRKGLGLGLPIACGLADILEHPLTFTSSAQRGSVFRLCVPLVTQTH